MSTFEQCGIDDTSIVGPNSTMDVASLPLPNVHPEPSIHSEPASSPISSTAQFLDTYSIDAGYGASDSRRQQEQNVLIWLVSESTS